MACSDKKTVVNLKVLDTLKVERIVGKRILIEDNSPTTVVVSATESEGIIVAPASVAPDVAAGGFTSTLAALASAVVLGASIRIIVADSGEELIPDPTGLTNVGQFTDISGASEAITEAAVPRITRAVTAPTLIPGVTQITTGGVSTLDVVADRAIANTALASLALAEASVTKTLVAGEATISSLTADNISVGKISATALTIGGVPIVPSPPVPTPIAQILANGQVFFPPGPFVNQIVVAVPPNSGYIPQISAISIDPALMIGISSGVSLFNITPTSFTILRQIGDETTTGATFTVIGTPA